MVLVVVLKDDYQYEVYMLVLGLMCLYYDGGICMIGGMEFLVNR